MQKKYLKQFERMNELKGTLQIKNIEKAFVKQNNQSWCGLACLSILCRYYVGDMSQEKLVRISGTNVSGTTLLGLYQAANTIGLEAEGLEGNIEELSKLDNPAILHFTLEDGLLHYVVYFGKSGDKFILADPAKGISYIDRGTLDKLWKSKTLLSVKKGENFKEVKDISKAKYEWLKSLLKPDFQILSVVLILNMVVSVLGITLALFSQKLVDDILPSKDFNRLILGTAILTALLLAKNFIGYLRTILSARQIKEFSNRIVGQFYSIILYLPKVFFDSLKTGEVTARLNDASRIQRTISYIFSTFIIDVLTIIVVAVFLFIYWWPTGLITIIGSLLFAYVFLKNAKKIIEGQKGVMVNYAQSESYFFDSVQGIDVIKSYGRENVFSSSGKGIYSIFQNSIFDLTILNNKIGLWAQNIAVILIISVISIGSYGVISDKITLGELMAIMAFSSTLLGSMSSLMGAYFTYQEAKVAYNRLYEFVSIEGEEVTATTDITSSGIEKIMSDELLSVDSLEIKNASFRYIGRPLVLKNLNFLAKKGETLAIVGDIGCGKSTLLSLILRLYWLEAGDILANNKSISQFSLNQWRSQVGLMPQNIKLFNATLIENICLEATEENFKKAIELCEKLGMSEYFNSLPLSYLTRVGEDGINLSGGQRQLVGLCRALFKNPSVLLLDEPTNNMDRKSTSLLWTIIENEKKNRICIIVTHDDLLAQKADYSVNL